MDSIEITVEYPDPSSIKISEFEGKLYIGNSARLNVVFTPERVSDETITWESSDNDVASISADGVITGKQTGRTTIKATSFNGKTHEIRVDVTVDPRTIKYSYVVNRSNGVFHSSGCWHIDQMSEWNKMYVTETWDYMMTYYTPCSDCYYKPY